MDSPDAGPIASDIPIDLARLHIGKTAVVAFETGDDVSSRQVLYEQGGANRGLNIYLEDGRLTFSAWDVRSGWERGAVSAPVQPNTAATAALVFDAEAQVLRGFVNGVEIGAAFGVQALSKHGDGVGYGLMNSESVFEEGGVSNQDFAFGGRLFGLRVYDASAEAAEVEALHEAMTPDLSQPAFVEASLTEDAEAALDLRALFSLGSDETIGEIQGPSHGRASVTDGVVTYRPDPDFHGGDSLAFAIEGGAGRSATLSLEVTPVNDAPTLEAATFMASGASAGTQIGRAAGADVDGDPLSYRLVGGDDAGAFAIDADSGVITLVDPVRHDGEATLTIEARDPAGATAIAEFQVKTMDETLVVVSTTAELTAAAQAASGGEIIALAPGVYDPITLKNIGASFSDPLRIISLDPDNPAQLQTLKLYGSENIHFENFLFDVEDSGYIRDRTQVLLNTVSKIEIRDSRFMGDAVGYAAVADDLAEKAIELRAGVDIVIAGNSFDAYGSIVGANHGSQGLRIIDNEMSRAQVNYVAVTGARDLLVENNVMRDPLGVDLAVDHPDFIHIITKELRDQNDGIVIRGNAFLSGRDAGKPHVIWISNPFEDGSKPVKNLLIEENVAFGHSWVQVAGRSFDGLTIRNNTMLTSPELAAVGWDNRIKEIDIRDAINVQIYNNVVDRLDLSNVDGDRIENNIEVQRFFEKQESFYGDLFFNARTTQVATVEDLMVVPGSALVRDDGTVHGAQRLAFDPRPDALTARALASTATPGEDGLSIDFDARWTADAEGAVDESSARFLWSFGDGTTAEGIRVRHVYAEPGDYAVTLTVVRDGGGADSVTIEAAAQDPVAMALDFADDAAELRSYGLDPAAVAAGLEAGPSGAAYRLDDGQGLGIEPSRSVTGLDQFGVAFAFKSDGLEDGYGALMRVTGKTFMLRRVDGDELEASLALADGGEAVIRTDGVDLTGGAWRHIAASFDGREGALKLFVDGAEVGRAEAFGHTPADLGANLTIGSRKSDGAYGLIDDVVFRSQAISEETAAALNDAFRAGADFDGLL